MSDSSASSRRSENNEIGLSWRMWFSRQDQHIPILEIRPAISKVAQVAQSNVAMLCFGLRCSVVSTRTRLSETLLLIVVSLSFPIQGAAREGRSRSRHEYGPYRAIARRNVVYLIEWGFESASNLSSKCMSFLSHIRSALKRQKRPARVEMLNIY